MKGQLADPVQRYHAGIPVSVGLPDRDRYIIDAEWFAELHADQTRLIFISFASLVDK